ncbi:MAG: DarT ssDNA thymidine ADP-ribosyltransferase family protein [Daejeonella sp.]
MSDTKTYIYRMTHYSNIEFILREGLHCCNCKPQDPEYTSIGYKTLINNRGRSVVSIDPGGVLNDYIPFYFHYKMPMLYNIWKKDVADTMVPRMRLFIW